MKRLVALLALASPALVACGGRAGAREARVDFPRLPAAVAALPSNAPPEGPFRIPPEDCGDAPVRVRVHDDLVLPCWPERDCHRSVAVAIDNCTGEDRVMVEMMAGDGTVGVDDPTHTLALPARSRSYVWVFPHENAVFHVGKGFVRVVTEPVEDHGNQATAEVAFEVVDPELARARAECKASGGEMRSGMFGVQRCDPVMTDAGKPCTDRSHCQGLCREERRTRLTTSWDRVVGRCTRFQHPSGCGSYIGKTNNGLVPTNEHFARMCID